jgi:hypothetical protein
MTPAYLVIVHLAARQLRLNLAPPLSERLTEYRVSY